MYEAVGLDAVIACIDTDGDEKYDHMACLVYWPGDADSFLDEEKTIMDILELVSPTGEYDLTYFYGSSPGFPEKSSSTYGDYSTGIWITADPSIAAAKDMVGYIIHEPYEIKLVIDVGN